MTSSGANGSAVVNGKNGESSEQQGQVKERKKSGLKMLGIKSPFKFMSGKNKTATMTITTSAAVDETTELVKMVDEKPTTMQKNNNAGAPPPKAAHKPPTMTSMKPDESTEDACGDCNQELRDGHALMAMDKQYHVWCFKCAACGMILQGEYMGKNGKPFCEKCYHDKFGVKCTYCQRFIAGKVLQAGNNNHFHPTCARCTKCGDPFGDGEEMFLQGAAIWHPRCGPGPEDPPESVLGDEDDGASMASRSYYGSRASSPGGRRHRHPASQPSFSRSTTFVPGWAWSSSQHQLAAGMGGSLYGATSTYSLRRPLAPGDRLNSVSSINHFHLPAGRRPNPASRFADSGSVAALVPSLQDQRRSRSTRPGQIGGERARTPAMGNGNPFSVAENGNPFSDNNGDDRSQRSFR